MTIILELAPELEERLRRRASLAGQEVADYVLAVEGTAQEDDEEERQEEKRQSEGSAADLFAGRIGLIHGSHHALSQSTRERFTQYLVEKQDVGRQRNNSRRN